MKATMRNTRDGNADHNDRNYDITNDTHINKAMVGKNIYWNIYGEDISFSEVEKRYYGEVYKDWTERHNDKYTKARKYKLCRSIDDLLTNKRYVPEETWLQIGNNNSNIDPYTFEVCVRDYIDALNRFSDNVHVLDWAIHYDESVPHAHIRKVYDYMDENGDRHISQSRALEKMGFSHADGHEPRGKYNNPKIEFDSYMREIWYDICESHGISIDRERAGAHEHMSKAEYVTQDNEREAERNIQLMQDSMKAVNQKMEEMYKKEAVMKQKVLKMAIREERRHGYEKAKKLLKDFGYPELKHELKKEIGLIRTQDAGQPW